MHGTQGLIISVLSLPKPRSSGDATTQSQLIIFRNFKNVIKQLTVDGSAKQNGFENNNIYFD